jgi:hypothetical protein
VPVFSTILFGGVDTITWVMISVFWLAIILPVAWRNLERQRPFNKSQFTAATHSGVVLIGPDTTNAS